MTPDIFRADWLPALDSSQVREILNGIWFCLDIFMEATFARRVIRDVARDRKSLRTNEVTQAAVALSVYLFGATIYRAWTWALLFAQASEMDVSYLGRYLLFPVVAAVIGTFGSSCVIRVFTPARWNPWLWISCAAASVAIPILIHVLFFPV